MCICVFMYFFLFLREEMSKDCLVRLVKLEQHSDDTCQSISSKTEAINLSFGAVDAKGSAFERMEVLSESDTPNVVHDDATPSESVNLSDDVVDIEASACDTTKVLQKQTETDSQNIVCKDASQSESVNLPDATDGEASACDTMEVLQKQSENDPQNVVCEDAAATANDPKMTDDDVDERDYANSAISDDDYLVIDENDDSASNDDVGTALPFQSSCGSENSIEKTDKKEEFEDIMCLSCVGTSELQTIKTNRQYQPFVRLKRLDSTELRRWTTARKSESRAQDKDHAGDSKYVICVFFSATNNDM